MQNYSIILSNYRGKRGINYELGVYYWMTEVRGARETDGMRKDEGVDEVQDQGGCIDNTNFYSCRNYHVVIST